MRNYLNYVTKHTDHRIALTHPWRDPLLLCRRLEAEPAFSAGAGSWRAAAVAGADRPADGNRELYAGLVSPP